MKEKSIPKNRSILCFFVVMLMLLSGFLRVAAIVAGDYGKLCEIQNEYVIYVSPKRGTIYDCNMNPLTNKDKKLIAAISPLPSAIAVAQEIVADFDKDETLKLLSNGKAAICEVKREIECEGISYAYIADIGSRVQNANHILGYHNNSKGLSGIESAYDQLLSCKDGVEAVFSSAGDGSLLKGVKPYFRNASQSKTSSLVLTIDSRIQSAAYDASKGLEKGAIVVCEADSGKIRAIVSRPDFDLNDISSALNSENSPLINRALLNFSVGSVFKPCVAAAALKTDKAGFKYNCGGSSFIIDRYFRCHNLSGHNEMNLSSAIANSCNTFFYNFAMYLGGETILNMAREFSMGSHIKIAENIKTAKGMLPSLSSLTNHANLANLSIGQGKLSLSPIALLPLYCAIATDGSYYMPSLIEKTVKNGVEIPYDKGAKTKVISNEDADELKGALMKVVASGTGKSAMPERVSAAGKTATAQTGRYSQDGTEITNSWFCGFFPAEKPRYVAVILSEGKPKTATTEIFAHLADSIAELDLL